MNENKKGQKDSEEEESIYEKEGKEGNNDMCGDYDPRSLLSQQVLPD